jgi:putative membrane protein
MFAAWPLDPAVANALLAAAIAYLVAERRVRRAHAPGAVSSARRWCFLGGIAILFAALQSPIDAAAGASFWAHMVQHLLITMAAAPLIVLAAPITLVLRAFPGAPRRTLLSVLHSRVARLVARPVLAWTVFIGFMWATHVSGLFEATLTNPWLHKAEHLAFLGTALLFWLPIAGVDPAPTRLSHPGRILYLFLAMPAMAFLGLTISSTRHVLYPAYAAIEGTAHALADQRLAGALMWEGGMVTMVLALSFVLLDWMRRDEHEAQRFDERLRGHPAPGPAWESSQPA